MMATEVARRNKGPLIIIIQTTAREHRSGREIGGRVLRRGSDIGVRRSGTGLGTTESLDEVDEKDLMHRSRSPKISEHGGRVLGG
jgi:hypothetical protein